MISDVVAVRILGLDRSTFEKQQSEAAEDEVKSNKISKKKIRNFEKFQKTDRNLQYQYTARYWTNRIVFWWRAL